ncbi:YezD family protein [Patescibacteria group bacterium]|nr:YezD family protein [Patescibacteria group bacterium]MCL5797921.1 YezD family protein [Patescibacteria group bacterium]
MVDYSTKKVTRDLVEEIKQALKNVRGFGSVEIYVQDFKVTQITERNIKKTNHNIKDI